MRSDVYINEGLTRKEMHAILRTKVKQANGDSDWDGVSSLVQIKKYFPNINVKISTDKQVHCDETTLVLDKAATGTGWLIDHHPGSRYVNGATENILYFSMFGEVPTSRLVFLMIDKHRNPDILISATAEITDDLYRMGLSRGSLYLLQKRKPGYFGPARFQNQYTKGEDIYTMADILATVAQKDPNHAFDVGLKFYGNLPKNSDELAAMLNSKNARLIDKYRNFLENLDIGNLVRGLDKIDLMGRDVMLMDGLSTGEFDMAALSIARNHRPGPYLMYRGAKVSLRADDEFAESVMRMFQKISESAGGRAGSYGITLKEKLTYKELKKFIRDESKNPDLVRIPSV